MFLPRRQSSVTGGREVEKVFGGTQTNFFLKFGSADQKKGLHSKLRLVSTGRLRRFGAQFSLRSEGEVRL